MIRRSPVLVLFTGILLFISGTSIISGDAGMSDTHTHPLMPGIRCEGINNTDWPRTLHDKQITGFSPLTCGMSQAPGIWKSIAIGGEVNWIEPVIRQDGRTQFLVEDGRLRLVNDDGEVVWTSDLNGKLVYFGDLRGNGCDAVILTTGPTLTVLDAETGETHWRHTFDPPHAHLRVAAADVLPDRPGMEAAVFQQYGEDCYLLNFPPEGTPTVVWARKAVPEGEWDERADHGCDVKITDWNGIPIIWNVRHHRCRAFDARTGRVLSDINYNMHGGPKRNYGPWEFATGRSGERYICVAGEYVQTHVHAIRLHTDTPCELAWEHYYGEVYEVPGVAVRMVGVTDMNGDGYDEFVYNARDPENEFRSFVRVRDPESGRILTEFPDSWCAGMVKDFGPDSTSILLIHPAPNGTMPGSGPLAIYRFNYSCEPVRVADFQNASVPENPVFHSPAGDKLILKTIRDSESQYIRISGGNFVRTDTASLPSLYENTIHQIYDHNGAPAFICSNTQGELEAVSWSGESLWKLPLAGGAPATLSAADTDGDGYAELAVIAPGERLRLFSTGGEEPAELMNLPFAGQRHREGPTFCTLDDSTNMYLIAPAPTPDGRIFIRAVRTDGSVLWETVLENTSTADNGKVTAWNVGRFLRNDDDTPRTGVAVSVFSNTRVMEGTYLLDGPTGRVLWFRDLYRDGNTIRGFRSCGIPSVFDYDGDGQDEMLMDFYSYMVFVRGDGELAYIHGTPNVQQENPLYAALLYNSFIPVYATPETERPHWFSPLGHGVIGMMNPAPSAGPWRVELGYDTPERAGIIDVDGDGVLEAGYAVRNSAEFICRNIWTGDVKWRLELPSPPTGPVIAADVDGDGRGEFLVDRYCIGTNEQGEGEVRWTSPVPFGWAIIADFDGDGRGEVACPGKGAIHILKAGMQAGTAVTEQTPETQQIRQDSLALEIPFAAYDIDRDGCYHVPQAIMVAGPFALEWDGTWVNQGRGIPTSAPGFTRAYPAESDTSHGIYESLDGAATWQTLERTGNGYFDFRPVFQTTDNTVCYAQCIVTAPRDMQTTLNIGSNDGIRFWVNGELVHSEEVARGAQPGQAVVSVQLRAGRNTILAKVSNLGGGWGLYLSATDPARELQFTAQ